MFAIGLNSTLSLNGIIEVEKKRSPPNNENAIAYPRNDTGIFSAGKVVKSPNWHIAHENSERLKHTRDIVMGGRRPRDAL